MSETAPTVVELHRKRIIVNAPGAGEMIMAMCAGTFSPETDHCIANFRDGRFVGGFAFTGFYGAAICVHMAGFGEKWCSRALMWMVFHYAFVQLGVRKVIALVSSKNETALAQDLRAGFQIEAVVKDVFPDGDMMILTMTKDRCRWLRYVPKDYAPTSDLERAL